MKLYSTTEAAQELGISPARVRQLLLSGRIPEAIKTSAGWIIPADALEQVRARKPGRPTGKKKKQGE